MSQRRRPAYSFKPVADHLEKLAGASSLAIGEFACAALAIVEATNAINPSPSQDASVELAGDDSGRIATSRPSPSPRPLEFLDLSVASSRRPAAEAADSVSRAKPTKPSHTPSAGEIRPLALAPAARPNTPAVAPPIFQPMPPVAAVSAGGGESPPSIGMTPAAASSAHGGISRFDAVTLLPGVPPAVAYSANGGISLPTAYVATGGPSRAASVDHPDLEGGGEVRSPFESNANLDSGSGSGTGTSSTSLTDASTATSGGPISTGSSYSISPTNASGGGSATGKIKINRAGSNLIGGGGGFSVIVEESIGPAPTLSDFHWEYSGSTPTYFGNPIPNPSLGHTGFGPRTPYNFAYQTTNSIGFKWGEIPSKGEMKVTATVSVNTQMGIKTANVKATIAANVVEPQYTGKIRNNVKTHIYSFFGDAVFQFGNPASIATDGIKWDLSTTSGGSIGVVQIINSAVFRRTINGNVCQSFVKRSPTGAITTAPFPLLDVPSNATTPWYGGLLANPNVIGDSPGFPVGEASTATFKFNVTNYVMYNPDPAQGGIWVPQAKFDWNIDASATWVGHITGWVVTDVTPPKVSGHAINHTTWPPLWNDVQGNWRDVYC